MTKYTFAHLADLHLGGYRESTLTNLNFKTFQDSIQIILKENFDFVLFAGDIFNNAMPPLDLVQKVVQELLKLKEKNIPVYVIGGSHDYSNTQKSFIHLLDSVGVIIDVGKYEQVSNGEVKLIYTNYNDDILISGIVGKKNGLDKNIYKNLSNLDLPDTKFKIFIFHTTLNDIKPDFLKSYKSEVTSSFLPIGFDYYAGGHVHTHINSSFNSKPLSYPGPLFPNNFTELTRERPSFNVCSIDTQTKDFNLKRQFINSIQTQHFLFEIKDKTPIEIQELIMEKIVNVDVRGKIVLLELKGIVNGLISEINTNNIVKQIYNLGAEHVLKNTSKLNTRDSNIKIVDDLSSVDEIENSILEENIDNLNQRDNAKKLLKLNLEKQEGEKNYQFEERVKDAIKKTISN